jgi:hypothetical protein
MSNYIRKLFDDKPLSSFVHDDFRCFFDFGIQPFGVERVAFVQFGSAIA